MNKKEEVVKVNILDVLLDDDNTAPIIMYNDDGKKVEFDQIAVIPLDEELYCILKPITIVEGIKDDEAVVFRVVQEGDEEAYLKVEENELTAIQVFDAYYSLIVEDVETTDKETIMSVIKSDPNLQDVYEEETKERIGYAKMDIHPFRFQSELFAIIKETPKTDFSEALVWKVETVENGEKRLVWVENEGLENIIINMYLRRHQND